MRSLFIHTGDTGAWFSGTTGFDFDGDGVISSGCDARLEKGVRVGEGMGG